MAEMVSISIKRRLISICRNGLMRPYWRLQFVILRDNKLVDYRSIADVDMNALSTALTGAGPGGSSSIEVEITLATNVNVLEVMPMDMAMTIYFSSILQTGDETVILDRTRTLYNDKDKLGPGKICSPVLKKLI